MCVVMNTGEQVQEVHFNRTLPLISLGRSHVGGRGELLYLSRSCFCFFSQIVRIYFIISWNVFNRQTESICLTITCLTALLQPYNAGLHFTLQMNYKEMQNFLLHQGGM